MIGTSFLDALERDLNMGGCEFFQFQLLPDDGNDALINNVSDVAWIAVTFFNDPGQPAFGECFDYRRVFLLKLFFLLFLPALTPEATIERHFLRRSRASASEKAGYSPSMIFCDLLSKR